MREIKLIILFLIFASPVSAENWICQTPDGLNRVNGDGVTLGICGTNNQNIVPACIEATKQEWDDSALPNKKLDKSVITGSRIVDMTQAEKDAILQTEADAKGQAEAAQLTLIDNTIIDVDMVGVKLQKVETAIDNIGTLNDAKKFLKRLVRYIASDQSGR